MLLGVFVLILKLGICLNKPNAKYEAKRVSSLCKVKPYKEAEVKLLSVRKGILWCVALSGAEFAVHCTPQVW